MYSVEFRLTALDFEETSAHGVTEYNLREWDAYTPEQQAAGLLDDVKRLAARLRTDVNWSGATLEIIAVHTDEAPVIVDEQGAPVVDHGEIPGEECDDGTCDCAGDDPCYWGHFPNCPHQVAPAPCGSCDAGLPMECTCPPGLEAWETEGGAQKDAAPAAKEEEVTAETAPAWVELISESSPRFRA